MTLKQFDAQTLQKGEGWVLVFPRGKHYIDKYEFILNCDDKFFSSIEQWWKTSDFKRPYLDKGHEFNERFGDFTDYRVTDLGLELYLKLNKEGLEMVKNGTYEYLSPTFCDAKDSSGTEYENVIYTVSLVNYPALLVLDKIQNQIALSAKKDGDLKITKGGSEMELREKIAGKLKLNFSADDGSILTRIEELLNADTSIESIKLEVAKWKTEAETSLQALQAQTLKTTEMETTLMSINKKVLEDDAKKVVDEAIRLGQYHPALKEMKVEQYLASPDSVKKELSVLPKVTPDKQKTSSIVDGVEFSAEDTAILLSAGYDLDDPKDLKLAKQFIEKQKEVK